MAGDEPQIYLKTYRSGGEVLVAACDCELMGKKFAKGPLQIEVCREFFGEEKVTLQEVEGALSRATIANLVGRHSVERAILLGYVDQEKVLVIEGIPCAQMVLM